MNFLAIDTSNEYLTVVASKEGKAEVLFEPQCGMQHSVRLMPAVEETLQRAGLSPAECDFFAAVTGPGSFTGIRIGMATIKALAYVCGKPAVGVTALELLAYTTKGEDPTVAVCDAANGMRYVAVYDGKMRELLSPKALSASELKDFLAEIEEPYALVADSRTAGEINAACPENFRDAFAAAVEAHASEAEDAGLLQPLYIRKPQAERDLEKKNGQAGD